MNGSSESDVEKRERFWNDLDRLVERVGNGCRFCVIGTLNGYVGDKVRVYIADTFGALG